jgi:CDP-glycerol:poly(glycerophosphate) glycerophosphotransferase
MSARFWRKPVDFFARRTHFVDHTLPIWEAMEGARGKFYVPEIIAEYAIGKGITDVVPLRSTTDVSAIQCAPEGTSPLLVCAYGDLQAAKRKSPQRPFIMMEHGVGLTPSEAHAGYAGGTGMRRQVDLFLAPNDFIRTKTAKAIPGVPQVVIGTPKMDPWAHRGWEIREHKPVVCISFHWNGEKVSREAGNAFLHYRDVLDDLAHQDDFKLIGHGHPKYMWFLEKEYQARGIEVVYDFEEVMERADLYVNDCSSTMYEFCVTGKPVVIVNAPWFRRDVDLGIRFWQYTDIGPMINEPEQLLGAIYKMIQLPCDYETQREQMVKDLYPFLGCSAQRAAGAILGFVGGKRG